MVLLLVGHRTCDLQVDGSSPGWASSRNGLGQASYYSVILCASVTVTEHGVQYTPII